MTENDDEDGTEEEEDGEEVEEVEGVKEDGQTSKGEGSRLTLIINPGSGMKDEDEG